MVQGVEGQNPLVVSLGIPPCGGDRGVCGERKGRGTEGDEDVTPFAATQVPHQGHHVAPGRVGGDSVVMTTGKHGGGEA